MTLYTEWYWKIDLHNLFHFLRLRLDDHAQMEIRKYAEIMAQIVKIVCPLAYEAFVDYQVNAVSFSGPELAIVEDHPQNSPRDQETLVKKGLSRREASEFAEKLDRILGGRKRSIG